MDIVRVALILIGFSSQYAPGVMERVVDTRQTPGAVAMALPEILPEVDGYIAVRDCDHIGEVWTLRGVERLTGEYLSDWERFLVSDCANPPGTDGAYEWMTDLGVMVEIDWPSAERWGTEGIICGVERLILYHSDEALQQ